MGLSTLAVIAGLMCLPVTAEAHSSSKSQPRTTKHRSEQRAAVVAILDAPHTRVSAAELRRIGPDVGAILVREAAAKQPTRRSVGALSLLIHFPKVGAAVLCRVAGDAKAAVQRRRAALRGCARIGGGAATAALSKGLHDRDLYIREASVYGLRDRGDAASIKLLRSHRKAEKSAMIRAAIDKVLANARGKKNVRRPTP